MQALQETQNFLDHCHKLGEVPQSIQKDTRYLHFAE